MLAQSRDWKSFWDISTPDRAAAEATLIYGPKAALAVVQCSLGAKADGRDEDHRFWLAVLDCLQRAPAPAPS